MKKGSNAGPPLPRGGVPAKPTAPPAPPPHRNLKGPPGPIPKCKPRPVYVQLSGRRSGKQYRQQLQGVFHLIARIEELEAEVKALKAVQLD